MSDIVRKISFPVDEDGFFSRECPFCIRLFRVLFKKGELDNYEQEGLDSFLIEKENEN